MMLLYVTLLFLSVSPITPCQDDPLYTTRCPSWRSHCSSGRWGPWMSVFCPSTCGVCRECQCEVGVGGVGVNHIILVGGAGQSCLQGQVWRVEETLCINKHPHKDICTGEMSQYLQVRILHY